MASNSGFFLMLYLLGFVFAFIGVHRGISYLIIRRAKQIRVLEAVAFDAQRRGDHSTLILILDAYGGAIRRQAITGLIWIAAAHGRDDVLTWIRIEVDAWELRRILYSNQRSSLKAGDLHYWFLLPKEDSVVGVSCVERLVAFALKLRPLSKLEAPLTDAEREAVARFKKPH